jgi:hypothetical protein
VHGKQPASRFLNRDRTLVVAMKSTKTGPPVAEWNFRLCPHPDQTKTCYLYEYSIESDEVKTEVEALRRKWNLRDTPRVRKQVADWWQSNPPPIGSAIVPASANERKAWKEWSDGLREAVPEAVVTTTLNSELHFLPGCDSFPTKHWLEIPAAKRKLIAQGFYPDRHRTGGLTDPAQLALRLEASPMIIEPLEDFLNPSRPFPPLTLKGYYALSVNWERSNRKLTEDFGQWLEENRPKDQPGLHRTKQSASRTTSPRDLLKNLSALRLIRHFEGNIQAARDYYYLVLEAFLYKDDSAWRKAEKKAIREITRFDQLA